MQSQNFEKIYELHHMKPAIFICENKGSDQPCSELAADQHFCFQYKDSIIPLLPKLEIWSVAIFCGCAAWFVSELVTNPKDSFFAMWLI